MSDDTEPKIMFAGEWIPAHEAWSKMETALTATEVIDRFNTRFPHLASEETQAVVPEVRRRLRDIQLSMPKGMARAPELRGRALELLQSQGPEDVLETLREEFDADIDMRSLLAITGREPYLVALQREAGELAQNKVSDEQAATLWNELQRPAPGGGLWTASKVRQVLDGEVD